MSDFAVRVLDESEFRPAMDLFRRAMHEPPVSDDLWHYESPVYRDGRGFGAFADRSLIGATVSFPSAVTIPGGRALPMAAVTFVGVRTDHRRRGVLSELMAAQLNSAVQAGEVIAGLRASEGGIYGRFGYGIATSARYITVSRRRVEFRPEVPRGGEVRLLDADEAVAILPAVYERIAGNRPGSVVRPPCWWSMAFERRVRVDGHMLAAVHTGPDGNDGFVTYQASDIAWETGDGGSTLRVFDLHGGNPSAVNDLWRFVLGVDLVDKVTAFIRPLDEPLEAMLVNQHVIRSELDDELWLRLVDVPAALSARSYADVAPVVLEVHDRLLPANSGCYRVGPEGAEPTTDEADAALPVDALAMIYLGGTRPSSLAAVGRVQARTPEALRRLDQLFAIDVPPWCGTMF